MINYIKFKCTICRRIKTITQDNQRASPDQCTITKGCLGRLVPVQETQQFEFTPEEAGVTDWYPRGQSRTPVQASSAAETISMAISASGGLTVAVPSTDESSLPAQLFIALEQRKSGDVEFVQFFYKVVEANNANDTTTISGKDLTGKNLRFDQTAIDQSRVTVRVNGVESLCALTPNKVTFTPALAVGSSIDILVYAEKDSVEKVLVLDRNTSVIPSLLRGAWSNVNFVDHTTVDGTTRYYLYSSTSVEGLTSGSIMITGNTVSDDALFLLASTPYQSVDRYPNFVVPQRALMGDFTVSNSSGQLTCSIDFMSELYPPLAIAVENLIVPNLYTTTGSAAVVTDTSAARLVGKKILGPV